MSLIKKIKRNFLPLLLIGIFTLGPLLLYNLKRDKYTKKEMSEVFHEDCLVETRIYSPSRRESYLDLKLMDIGPMTGLGFNGEIGVSLDSDFQINESEIPEKYGIVFKCQEKILTSEGFNERDKNLYDRVREGEKIDVTYQEIYQSTYDDVDGDGKNDLVARVLIGYDFLDAQPK